MVLLINGFYAYIMLRFTIDNTVSTLIKIIFLEAKPLLLYYAVCPSHNDRLRHSKSNYVLYTSNNSKIIQHIKLDLLGKNVDLKRS